MASNIVFHTQFDSFDNDKMSMVFEIFPPIFHDNRGYFCEVFKEARNGFLNEEIPWLNNACWISQINRSCSKGKTIRGCHAQNGSFCQAKLVQALTAKIYDFITDARPDSKTFGVTQVFILDPEKQNQLFIPRGFLHAFATTEDKPAIFEYMCDNIFDKSSETGVSPLSILPNVVNKLEQLSHNDSKIANDFFDLFMLFKDLSKVNMSDKDTSAVDYASWMKNIQDNYTQNHKLWYR